jgi:hypothetical protein
MRRLRFLLWLLASMAAGLVSSTAPAQILTNTVNVTFTYAYFTSLIASNLGTICMTPIAPAGDYGGNLPLATPGCFAVTNTNSFTYSNVYSGAAYQIVFTDIYGVTNAITNFYPSTLSGNIQGSQYQTRGLGFDALGYVISASYVFPYPSNVVSGTITVSNLYATNLYGFLWDLGGTNQTGSAALTNLAAGNGSALNSLTAPNLVGQIPNNSLSNGPSFAGGIPQIGSYTGMPSSSAGWGSASQPLWILGGNTNINVTNNEGFDAGITIVAISAPRQTINFAYVTTNAALYNGGGGSGPKFTNSAGIIFGWVNYYGVLGIENEQGVALNGIAVFEMGNNGNPIAVIDTTTVSGVSGNYPYVFYDPTNGVTHFSMWLPGVVNPYNPTNVDVFWITNINSIHGGGAGVQSLTVNSNLNLGANANLIVNGNQWNSTVSGHTYQMNLGVADPNSVVSVSNVTANEPSGSVAFAVGASGNGIGQHTSGGVDIFANTAVIGSFFPSGDGPNNEAGLRLQGSGGAIWSQIGTGIVIYNKTIATYNTNQYAIQPSGYSNALGFNLSGMLQHTGGALITNTDGTNIIEIWTNFTVGWVTLGPSNTISSAANSLYGILRP